MGEEVTSVDRLDAALPVIDVGKLKATLKTVPSHYSRDCDVLSH
jgi:hypothetical protein